MFARFRRRGARVDDCMPANPAATLAESASTDTSSTLTARRGLIGAALASGAAIAVSQRGGTALAVHQPEDVLLGGANLETTPTYITRTNGGSALILQNGGNYGHGLTVESVTGYGVQATGAYAGVNGDTDSSSGVGVSGVGRTDGGIGVAGGSVGERGIGVSAACELGVGVLAQTGTFSPFNGPSHVAMVALCGDDTGLAASLAGGRAPLRLVPLETAGAPTTGEHDAGEILVDADGVLFYCRTAGTPGTWIQVEAPAAPIVVPSVPVLHTLPTPERFVDTRSGLGGVQGPVPAVTTHTFVMTGRVGQANDATLKIPDNATTLVGNLTVVGSDGVPLGSFATIWPSGPLPTVSNINFGPKNVTGAIANSFVVGLAASGGHGNVNVYNHASCDYILDVTGYYTNS